MNLRAVKSIRLAVIIAGLAISSSLFAELPTAPQLASKMKVGWNLGNTLEAPGGETTWNGGVMTTQKLIDSVKMAGFNTVRLPVAWFSHSDTVTNVIKDAWLSRVREVVNYCIKDSMYVIINIHWDSGWLEKHITVADSARVNARQKAYWTQIANYFKYYGDHLLFASANEPDAKDATGMAVLLSYHQTFVNAVRSTGGNNTTRSLIIQAPQTNIELSNSLMNKMPVDPTPNRLMVEVHYYTPWQFCIMDKDGTYSWEKMYYYWGKDFHSKTDDPIRNASYGEEAYVESALNLMKTKFVDNGIPVIIGEYAAIRRKLSNPTDQALHDASFANYFKYVTKSMISKGIIPYCWDINMGMFNRSTGKLLDVALKNAIMQGAQEAQATAIPHVFESKLSVYPNPFQTAFTLDIENLSGLKQVVITDMLGKVVESSNPQSGRNLFGERLKPGVYVVRIVGNNWSKTAMVIKE
ncbi:MAG: cellulase family glycosylhydrolase [Paludibacter sp.]|nr:cellulase family glycosylhydrolase [Paludibacter sp.]